MPNWGQILNEISRSRATNTQRARAAHDIIRRKYLRKLQAKTGRNVIAYYSGFLSKPDIAGTDIIDEDKNGLMMAIHQLDKPLGLDLILHTPGGSIATAETIVDYLKSMFSGNMRTIVPQIAMSAGTMIACASQTIVMGKHSNLGPVDPQLNGIPAAGVKEEFERAQNEIRADPNALNTWRFVLQQYTPTFLRQCEMAVDWATDFTRAELESNMFAGDPQAKAKARKIVKALTDFSGNRAHDRHIHYDECESIGLKVERLEKDPELQDLVLTVHHCYMHALMNTPAFKIIENHNGVAFVKQQQMVQVQGP